MDDRLRVHEHLYLLHVHAEQPFGLDDLEAFVHVRCGIDGDFVAHLPVGVTQRIGSRGFAYLLHRPGAERSAAAGEQNLLYLVAVFTHQALEDSGMLAIDRQYRRMELRGEAANQFARHNERFFVGERNGLARTDSFDSGTQSGVAYHRRHDDINGRESDHFGYGISACPHLDGQVLKRVAKFGVHRLIGDAHHLGMKLARLRNQLIYRPIGGDGVHLEEVGVVAHHVQRLRTDTAGRA